MGCGGNDERARLPSALEVLAEERDEARAEVERLRVRVVQLREGSKAELERLRAELQGVRAESAMLVEGLADIGLELQRLRAGLREIARQMDAEELGYVATKHMREYAQDLRILLDEER